MRLIKRRSSTSLSVNQDPSSSSSPIPDIQIPPVPTVSPVLDNVSSPVKGVKGKKKRDSQEMKYPPTSFGQSGAGWSFGRMRSFKGKSRAGQDPSVSGSEDEGDSSVGKIGKGKGKGRQASVESLKASSQPSLPITSTSPSPLVYDIPMQTASPVSPLPNHTQTLLLDSYASPDFTSSPPLSSSSSSQRPYPQPTQPITAFTPQMPHPTPIALLAAAQAESIFSSSTSRPPLITALSATSSEPSFESGESSPSYPLIARSDDGQPRRRITTGPTSPRKLTKRRPVSIIYDQVELLERPLTSSNRPSKDFEHDSSPQVYTVLSSPPVPALSVSARLPLPEGAAPPHHHNNHLDWPLNRNPSCSTNASSGMTPSTDESGTLETPNNAFIVPGHGEDRLWERIGEPRPPLSRSSTFSFKEGDDESITKRESYFFQQKTKRDEIFSDGRRKRNSNPSGQMSPSGGSPTFPTNTSNVTYTPTVSSGSDVTARLPRNLRISTSNLELKTSKNETLISPTAPLPKKAVLFNVQSPTSVDTPREEGSIPTRPPLSRLRSSSLGAMSINTNSVYSVGEIAVATNAVVATPRAVNIRNPANMEGDLAEMLAGFENSSEAIRRAFDNERERGDWPLSASPEETIEIEKPFTGSRRKVHTVRAAPPPPRLLSPFERNSRPPLSPILRSSSSVTSPKKLVSFNSTTTNTTISEEISQASLKRPTMPSRSSSLGRLWRRLSSSGSGIKMSKSKSSFNDFDDDIPPVPQARKTDCYGSLTESSTKSPLNSNNLERVMSTRMKRSKGSLDLTSVVGGDKENPEFFIPGSMKDSNPSPTPSSVSSQRKSKEKKRMSSIPPPRAASVPLPIRSDTPPVIPPLESTPPLSTSPEKLPINLDEPPPVRSFRKIPSATSNSWKTPLGPYTPPLSAIVNDYFRDLKSNINTTSSENLFTKEVTLGRTSLHEDSEYQSYDAKRRYRQSLVEIKDDQAFQDTVEQLVKLESDGRVRMTRAGGAALRNNELSQMPLLFRTPSKDLVEKRERQENIRAWFVTRELVQGERRHGRLLAKGVAAVQLAAQAKKDIPPVPPIPTSDNVEHDSLPSRPIRSSGHSRSGSGNIKTPSLLRRSRTSTTPSIVSTPNSSSLALPSSFASPSPSPTMLTKIPNIIQQTPIEILLNSLPKLYSLSLKLSERFEHDPSPYGVADAFLSMESILIKEISEWSSKIGEIVYSGIGEELNRILENQKLSIKKKKLRNRRISEGEPGPGFETDDEIVMEDEGVEGRLRFADIIIVPIQRASRYRLLFQELSTKLPSTSHTSLKIQRALEASTRLAIECDKCQSFDLGALRRQGKKSKRIRPVSVGPSVRA